MKCTRCIALTQIANLPSALETYYQQYFTDRQKIVDYANGYEQIFIADQSFVSQYDSQLSAMKTEITTNESSPNSDQQSISSLESSLSQAINSANNSDDGLSIPTLNSEVESYNNTPRPPRNSS